MGTVTSVGSGNYNTGSTWDSGARPGSSDDVVIANGHDVTLVQDENANSLEVESGGTLTVSGGTHKITIDGENSSGFAANINGAIVESGGGKLQLQIETQATTTINIVPSSGNVHHLRLNHASADVHYSGNTTLTGNLNITLGTFNCSNSAGSFTVAGRTDIGPASGSADQATLTCGDATMSLGSGRTSSFALVVNQGGTFAGGSGTHTIGSIETKNNSNAKMTMTSGECTIDSENSGDNRAILVETNATFDNNDGTIKITHAGDTNIEFKSGTTSPKCPHNFTIDKSDNDVVTHGDLRIDNDLFIKIVDTSHSMRPSSASDTLTVIGDVTLNKGKLGASTNYTSAISFGSLTIDADGEYIATSGTTTITSKASSNFAFKNEGTFTHNSGTMQIGDGSTSTGGAHLMNTTYHNLIINRDQNAPDGNTPWRPSSGSEVTIAGDLTVTKGRFYRNNSSNSLVVTGDVDIAANGQVGTDAASGSNTFGSLTINSGGTYLATSGTTTITNKNSSNYMFFDAGTFTHNNGTVHFKADTSSGTWYAVKGHSTEDTTEFYNVTTERVGSSVGNYRVCVGGSNQFFTVRNNLTVGANCKIFSSNGSSILRQSGLAILDGELDLDSFTDIEMGAVTINSGGTLEFDNGSITIKAESLRNVGGTINA